MKSVAIIGAGITGLTAAFYLHRKGIPVTVYEGSGRVGGVIQSLRHDGYLVEFGPNTILETSQKISELIRDVGLQSRRVNTDSRAEARYVVRYKRPIAMPSSPVDFLTTDLFSWKAKLAVLREPFVARRTDGKEESVAEFVVRRLGQEFLDHAIDALVAGVYAGDPQKLSVSQAFPKLAALEQKYGSLIKGQILGARERKKRGEISRAHAPKFSFDEGLQVLPDTLREKLGNAVRLNTSVTKLVKTADGWRVSSSRGENDYSAVVFCGTAHRLSVLAVNSMSDAHEVTTPALADLAKLGDIHYPPVASVVLGFRREDVAHSCEGFGMLIPKIEGFNILGTIFSSSLFPNRAPAGHHLLTTYVGGARYPDLTRLPEEQLYKIVCEDLRTLLGVQGRPTFQHCVVYPRAIPQYNIGYGRFRQLMTDAESQLPGFFLAGHYRDGVSLSDSILSGCNVADRVADSLNR